MAVPCTIAPAAGGRVRVLIVDDSVVIRRLVAQALEEVPGIEVVGSAANGRIALQRIDQLNPDAVTLDVEMPEMDGIETLRQLRKTHPKLRVVMFSTLTQRGASATLDALAAGADDYVMKASNHGSLDKSLVTLRGELVPKIMQFFVLPAPRLAAPVEKPRVLASRAPKALVVGVSTGGPIALASFIPRLPEDFPVPVLVVQHMPPMFTQLLAERLAAQSRLAVEEASEGAAMTPGKVLIAAGDYHLQVRLADGKPVAALDQGPPENSCRPAVDVLFRSAAEFWGGAVVAVILTGMGQDGLRGAELLRARGARVIAQDKASSVVWGMPGAVVGAGLADAVVPLEQMAAEVTRQFR